MTTAKFKTNLKFPKDAPDWYQEGFDQLQSMASNVQNLMQSGIGLENLNMSITTVEVNPGVTSYPIPLGKVTGVQGALVINYGTTELLDYSISSIRGVLTLSVTSPSTRRITLLVIGA